MTSYDVTVKVNEGSHGKKRRKVVKKLVNKMYIDEDGAMGRSLILYH